MQQVGLVFLLISGSSEVVDRGSLELCGRHWLCINVRCQLYLIVDWPRFQDTATDAQEGSGVGEMILECLVVPQDHDGGLLIEAKKGYYVFCRSLLGNSSVGEPQILDVGTQMGPGTLRVTRHESTYGYVVFETKENAEAFAKGNAGIISAAEWYIPQEISYVLHLRIC